MSDTCYHCGQSIPKGTAITAELHGVSRSFCCHACEAVAQLISGADLQQYYQTRTNVAPRPQLSAIRWDAYDIPAIASQYVHRENGDNEIHLYIDGIHCGACGWLICRLLKSELNLENVSVNTTTARAEIHYPDDVNLSQILATIAKLGYTPNLYTPEQTEKRQNKMRNQYLLRLIIAGLGMMQVMMFATGLYTGEYFGIEKQYAQLLRWISLGTATPVFLYSGWPFLSNAWLGLKARCVNMDLPIALAIAGAYFASVYHTIIGRGEIYFDSVTMFIFFLSISRFLEFLTRRRAQLNEVQFAKLLPEAVEKQTNGQWVLTPLSAIGKEDEIRIFPAQTIAIDGVIVQGQTRADESMLTGESTAVNKTIGDSVFAGSHNLESPIIVRVTAAGQETVLAGLRRLMSRAQQHQSNILTNSQQLAKYTIIGVLILAMISYGIWYLIKPSQAFNIALAVLVATCPCALSLAAPATLTAAINHAHRQHILIKQSDSLDKLQHIRHILFDKTGTLTEGNYRLITQTIYHPDANFIWQISKSLEKHSPHPIAWAIVQQTAAPELPLTDIQQNRGQGISARYQGEHWTIGSIAAITATYPHLEIPISQPLTLPPNTAHVYLANTKGIQAEFYLADPLRKNIPQTLAELKNREHHLASGDTTENVRMIAEQLDIRDWHANLTPEGKIHILEGLTGDTLMIGDGINDGPVMAQATLSVAVGKANPLSQTQADIVFMHHGPEALPYLFQLAQRTRQIIHQNMIWAILYNLIVLPLAILGHLTPWIAALGMSSSSLIVTLNALRISSLSPPKSSE